MQRNVAFYTKQDLCIRLTPRPFVYCPGADVGELLPLINNCISEGHADLWNHADILGNELQEWLLVGLQLFCFYFLC